MNMLNQQQTQALKRDISPARMRKYFTPFKFPWKSTIALVIGFLVMVSGFATHNLLPGLIGTAITAVGMSALVFIITSKPTDRQYDDWVESHARALIPLGLKRLNLDRRQLVRRPIRADSFVLTGSQAAEHYPAEEVRMKLGRDGVWRFSIHVYTYFYAAEHYIAVFTCDVNALRQGGPHIEATEEYFYKDIVGATMGTFYDAAIIEEYEYRYRIQKFSLRISNGDVIDLGAYVNARPVGNYPSAPVFSLPTTNIDYTLGELRDLLRFEKSKYM